MSMPGFVTVAESLHESEAQVVVGLLESEGIEALINEDDAGNMIPSLEESRGVQVLVAEKDAKRAMAIIEEFEREDEDEDEEE